MSEVRALVTITGKVQGVYFRWTTQEEARKRGVKGWVRNCPDGSVQAEFEGDRKAVEELISWCHQGPPEARVRAVQVRWDTPTGTYTDFTVRY